MEWILNRGFWIVHVVLIGLFALALASVSARIVGSRLEQNSPQVGPTTKRSVRTLKPQRKSRSHYSTILDKNIFHAVVKETSPSKKPVEEKPVTADQLEDLATTPLSVRLRGTAVREKGGSFAVIEDKRARKEDLYRVGDMILGEAKLIQIFEDRVVLLRDGKKETLELFVEKEQPKGQTRQVVSSERSPQVLGRGIRRLGGNRWSVSREEIELAKANMSQLMTQVRIVPNFLEGEPDGFKLLSIKRGSIFDRLGLRNGDVIRKINGVPLDSPQKAFEVYEGLESGQSITVDILRGKREQTLNYQLR
ncbi:MAG: PDZ domain-containing protein [Proteobacteria bacterium]|nr:PDZ domain-containing protein [Pseudomonadota bacterium]